MAAVQVRRQSQRDEELGAVADFAIAAAQRGHAEHARFERVAKQTLPWIRAAHNNGQKQAGSRTQICAHARPRALCEPSPRPAVRNSDGSNNRPNSVPSRHNSPRPRIKRPQAPAPCATHAHTRANATSAHFRTQRTHAATQRHRHPCISIRAPAAPLPLRGPLRSAAPPRRTPSRRRCIDHPSRRRAGDPHPGSRSLGLRDGTGYLHHPRHHQRRTTQQRRDNRCQSHPADDIIVIHCRSSSHINVDTHTSSSHNQDLTREVNSRTIASVTAHTRRDVRRGYLNPPMPARASAHLCTRAARPPSRRPQHPQAPSSQHTTF